MKRTFTSASLNAQVVRKYILCEYSDSEGIVDLKKIETYAEHEVAEAAQDYLRNNVGVRVVVLNEIALSQSSWG